jgi:hypothetical protein
MTRVGIKVTGMVFIFIPNNVESVKKFIGEKLLDMEIVINENANLPRLHLNVTDEEINNAVKNIK